jgi:excisionase family DNA binding protein
MVINMEEKLLTASDVAKKYNFTSDAVRKWIKEGKLKAIRVGSRWRIPEESLQQFLQNSLESKKDD